VNVSFRNLTLLLTLLTPVLVFSHPAAAVCDNGICQDLNEAYAWCGNICGYSRPLTSAWSRDAPAGPAPQVMAGATAMKTGNTTITRATAFLWGQATAMKTIAENVDSTPRKPLVRPLRLRMRGARAT
jgi:hypothetical protein